MLRWYYFQVKLHLRKWRLTGLARRRHCQRVAAALTVTSSRLLIGRREHAMFVRRVSGGVCRVRHLWCAASPNNRHSRNSENLYNKSQARIEKKSSITFLVRCPLTVDKPCVEIASFFFFFYICNSPKSVPPKQPSSPADFDTFVPLLLTLTLIPCCWWLTGALPTAIFCTWLIKQCAVEHSSCAGCMFKTLTSAPSHSVVT